MKNDINQEGLSTELVTIVNHEHNDINPDYGAIATGAAVTGFVAGLVVVGGEYISHIKEDYTGNTGRPTSEGGSSLNDATTPNGGLTGSNLGVNVVNVDGVWYLEKYITAAGTFTADAVPASFVETYITGSQNPLFQLLNTLPGSPSFVDFHDAALEGFGLTATMLTIPPFYALSQCAAMPAICANSPGTFINVGTGGFVKPKSVTSSKPKGRQSVSLLDNLMK